MFQRAHVWTRLLPQLSINNFLCGNENTAVSDFKPKILVFPATLVNPAAVS